MIAGALDSVCKVGSPVLALAPMQDVTDFAFWKLMASYGGADVYFTEYFRVTQDSRLDRDILRSVTENPTGRPAIAQMIGNDIDAMVRTAKELQKHAVAGIDLNLGCPAPVVYRKCAGGGLLRDLPRIDRILAALRQAITEVPFTVKTRVGFDHHSEFDALLQVFARHPIDMLTIHARTVREGYSDVVHYDRIRQATDALDIPILANGSVDGPESALEILATTGARGLMIGRGAIRNPWMFSQIRSAVKGEEFTEPTGRDVLEYIRKLYNAVITPGVSEEAQVHRMKKYLNFIGAGADDGGTFLHAIRRVSTKVEFFAICEAHLNHDREWRYPSPKSLVA